MRSLRKETRHGQVLRFASALLMPAFCIAIGCAERDSPIPESVPSSNSSPTPNFEIQNTWPIDDFPDQEIVQFKSVFWEPDDTTSLRQLIRSTDLVAGKRVLEIGVGTGLISLCCLKAKASHVIGTDINPAAVACARFNADHLGLRDHFEFRQVSGKNPTAFAVLDPSEKFDLIISNPPWEDGTPREAKDHAFYDPSFSLLESIIKGLDRRLLPGGRCLLAYGSTAAVNETQRLAREHSYICKILDDRELKTLPDVFLPGMLLELRRESPPTAGN